LQLARNFHFARAPHAINWAWDVGRLLDFLAAQLQNFGSVETGGMFYIMPKSLSIFSNVAHSREERIRWPRGLPQCGVIEKKTFIHQSNFLRQIITEKLICSLKIQLFCRV